MVRSPAVVGLVALSVVVVAVLVLAWLRRESEPPRWLYTLGVVVLMLGLLAVLLFSPGGSDAPPSPVVHVAVVHEIEGAFTAESRWQIHHHVRIDDARLAQAARGARRGEGEPGEGEAQLEPGILRRHLTTAFLADGWQRVESSRGSIAFERSRDVASVLDGWWPLTSTQRIPTDLPPGRAEGLEFVPVPGTGSVAVLVAPRSLVMTTYPQARPDRRALTGGLEETVVPVSGMTERHTRTPPATISMDVAAQPVRSMAVGSWLARRATAGGAVLMVAALEAIAILLLVVGRPTLPDRVAARFKRRLDTGHAGAAQDG